MKSIEDLYTEKIILQKEKDAEGTIIEIPISKKVKRFPNLVTPGMRFGYFVIDIVVIYVLASLVGFISAIIDPYLINSPVFDAVGYAILFLYYMLMEGFIGATVGKLILGYTVINTQAEKPSFGTIMLRTICRYVPFEAFSCFAERGWHDQWSDTYVVHKSEQAELQKLLGNIHSSNELLD